MVFIALAVATAVVRPPFRDEAWFASPAISWITHGHTGSTILQPDSWLPNLPGEARLTRIDERTYWIMPVHTWLQAAWYSIVGTGLLEMRLLSVLSGACGLIALFVYVRRLFDSPRVAAIAVALTAIDHRYVTMSGHGRMDVIAASLGLMSLAWYVTFRQTRLRLAVAGAVAVSAAAVLTHPVAVAGSASLALLVWRLDRDRFQASHLVIALGVATSAAVLFAAYAFQDITAFRDQLGSNAAGRLSDLFRPDLAVVGAAGLFFGTYAFGGGLGTVGMLIPLLLTVGAVGAFVWGSDRFRCARVIVAGQVLTVIVYLTFLDSQKLHFYLVHVTPLVIALCSAFVVDVVDAGVTWRRRAVLAGVVLLVLVQLAPTAARIGLRARHRMFTPVIEAVRAAAGTNGKIVGSAELAFDFGFDRVDDDRRLRIARRMPDAVVVLSEEDKMYWPWLPAHEQRDIAHELSRRPLVFRNDQYMVFGTRRQ